MLCYVMCTLLGNKNIKFETRGVWGGGKKEWGKVRIEIEKIIVIII